MDILKTLIQQCDDGSIFVCDTIRWQGKLWLVPEWLVGPDLATEIPARVIGLDGLPLQNGQPQADYLLAIPLSKATLAGATAQGLDVIERPEIVRGADNLQ